MKQIYSYIVDYVKTDFNIKSYLYVFAFLAITISANYYLDFEDSVLDSYFGSVQGIIYYTLFYAFAYYFTLVPVLYLSNQKDYLSDKKVWIYSLVFILIIGISGSQYTHRYFLNFFQDKHEHYYMFKILGNAKVVIPIFLLILVSLFMYRNEKMNYGFTFKNSNLKPYFILLLMMVPLITFASFLPDFQEQYPVFKNWKVNEVFGLSKTSMTLIYETFYGLSYINTELMFRGALIIGLAKFLDKNVVLPMVVTYAFLHFGKPLGETISSVFGGYILGVIALRTNHILGGCIIHIGIALLMEFAAYMQYIFGN